jgi:hypothetical protein
MVQFDAEFFFLQHGTTTSLYDALTPFPWPYFVFHFRYRANYFWSQLFNIALTITSARGVRGTFASSVNTRRIWIR